MTAPFRVYGANSRRSDIWEGGIGILFLALGGRAAVVEVIAGRGWAMPAGFIPDEGATIPLAAWLKDTSPILLPWKLVLWVNDITPTNTVVWGDLTEATFGGYSRVTLTRSTWTSPTLTDECVSSQWGSSPFVWMNTGSSTPTIYGWAMLDDIAGQLRFIQRFDSDDIGPLNPGGRFSLLPRITQTNAPCAGEMLTLPRLRKPGERKRR